MANPKITNEWLENVALKYLQEWQSYVPRQTNKKQVEKAIQSLAKISIGTHCRRFSLPSDCEFAENPREAYCELMDREGSSRWWRPVNVEHGQTFWLTICRRDPRVFDEHNKLLKYFISFPQTNDFRSLMSSQVTAATVIVPWSTASNLAIHECLYKEFTWPDRMFEREILQAIEALKIIKQNCSDMLIYPDKIVLLPPVSCYHLAGNRLHCDFEPAVSIADINIWMLHGTIVPRWLVVTPPEQIKPQRLVQITNAQVRSEFIRKVGIDRCWYKLARVIDEKGPYQLGLLPVHSDQGKYNHKYLKMQNPSVPELWHVEGVSNRCKTVAEALRWRLPKRFKHLPFDKNGSEWYQQGDVVIVPKGATTLKPTPVILT